MRFEGSRIAMATGGTLLREGAAGAVCTDTRALQEGQWFLALSGDRFDGHDWLPQARDKGCAGAIVTRVPPDWDRGLVQVHDPLRALQDLASHVRGSFSGPVVGITGSVGKTTTRALTVCALSGLGHVHHTSGNLNNHVGLPLTLLALPDAGAQAMVLELGMSALGEIARLQEIAAPTVRLITVVAPAHLETLGSMENIARAKGELFDGARPGDVLCVNLDDPRVAALPRPEGVRVVTWGAAAPAQVRLVRAVVEGDSQSTLLEVAVDGLTLEARIPVPGVHVAQDAVAALSVARALGLDMAGAARALSRYEPVGMRLRIEEHPRGFRLLNDAYNANPASMGAALDTLASLPGRRIALLGDMLELGPEEIRLHREVVESALDRDIHIVGVCGPRMTLASRDLPTDRLVVAPDAPSLGETIRAHVGPGDVVLLKGSRGTAMERLLLALAPPPLTRD